MSQVSHNGGQIHTLPVDSFVFASAIRIRSPQRTKLQSNLADGQATEAEAFKMSYADPVDYVEILREKIRRLRVEIAEIRELNEQCRLQGEKAVDAEIAYQKRRERLQAIQQELAQIADFGRKVTSVEEMGGQHDPLRHFIKKAS
jgi:hypothetical protein